MMAQPVRFPYTPAGTSPTSVMPRLSLMLSYAQRSAEVTGLLDTGAAVSVLPYSVGQALGADWDSQMTTVHLAGSLGQIEARALILAASHAQFTPHEPVRLVFAWTQAEDTPVIFGQTNFFMEFDACFYRSESVFEVHPHRG